MHVLDQFGGKLFTGTRHDCKQFVRKHRIKRYKFVERYSEKVVVAEPTVESNPLSEPETPEGFFNKVFEKTNDDE